MLRADWCLACLTFIMQSQTQSQTAYTSHQSQSTHSCLTCLTFFIR